MNRRAMLSVVVPLVAFVAGACGSSSPSSPSGSQAVTIQGVVLGGSGAAPLTALSNHAQANGGTGTVTVTIAGSSTTTTVTATGTFELHTDPGDFSLVFRSDGAELGQVGVTATSGSKVRVVVQIWQKTLTVVEVKVDDTTETGSNCVVNGGKDGEGIELEGKVNQAVDAANFTMTVNGNRAGLGVLVHAAGASFKCNGAPKETEADCKASLKAGLKVHVSGVLDAGSCTSATPSVSAREVKLQ